MASWRRRLTRLFGWLIAAFASFVATVVLALTVYLIYFGDGTYIEQRLESELSRMSGGAATIGSIDLDLPSLSFELNDIVVAGSDPEVRLLQVERIWGSFRLSDMARMRLHFRALAVQGLTLRLADDPSGGFRVPGVEDLPSPSLTPAFGAGLRFSADRVSLERASVVVANDRVPWRLDAENLGFALEGDGRDNYKGQVSYERGTLAIRDYPPIAGSVSADIELAAGELFVHEASGESDVGSITARGKLNMAGGVTGRFDVAAKGDLGLASASILGIADGPLEGEATFRGTLSVGANDDALEGTLGLASGRVLGLALDDWTGELFWDRQLLQVPLAQGGLGGGRARLQLHQALPLDEHDGSVDVELAGASLTRLLQRAGAPESPVEALVDARASLTFSPATPLEPSGVFELSGAPPSTPTPGSESFAFEVSGRVDAGDVEVSTGTFEGADLVASLRGTYPRIGEAVLQVEVASGDLGRLDSLAVRIRTALRPPGEAAPEAWNINGRGNARGILTGRFPHPTFAGDVMAGPLSYAGLPLDEVRGQGTLSREALELRAFSGRRADGVVSGSGRLELSGPFDSRGFDLRLRADRWPAFELSAALAGSAPLEGLVDGDIALARTERGLDGEGQLVVTDGRIAGVSFDRATGKALFSGSRARLEDVTIVRSGVPLEGRFELEPVTGQILGELRTRGLPLAGILLAGVPVGGTLDADARVSGTVQDPLVEVTGQGRGLRLGTRSLSGAVVDASVRGRLFSLDLELEEGISVTATAGLDGAPPLRGRIRFEALDAAPWVARISEPLAEATQLFLTGEADFEAEGGRLRDIRVDARVERVVLEASDRRLVSLAPVAARYQDGTLHIPSLSLGEGEDWVEAGGTVDFRGEQLELRAEGNVQLAILSTLYPSLAATGGVDLSARVSGAWGSPAFAGHADLDGNSLRFAGFAQAVGGLRGRIVFDNRTIRIPSLEGVFGSGPIEASGAVSLEGMRPGAIDVRVQGTDMRLRYPEGLVATLDADLTLLGNGDEQVLSGDVTLSDAVWSREYDLVSGVLSDSEGFALFDRFDGDELFEDLRFDVRIVAPQSLRLRNSLAEVDASADLELRGTLRDPVLLGSTQAERGEVYLLGQRYDITSGKVDFVDPNRIEPFIELTAETRVRSYRVELRLTGTSQRFSPELSSDPPLRTVDILRLLSGASELDLGGNLVGNEEEELVGVGVASLLTERLSQEVGRRAERLFGLDRFSIDPFLVGRIANPTARVSLGKQITRDLSINYSTNLNTTTEAVILIEYTPEGNVSWILSRDDEGDVGIDVKFRKSF